MLSLVAFNHSENECGASDFRIPNLNRARLRPAPRSRCAANLRPPTLKRYEIDGKEPDMKSQTRRRRPYGEVTLQRGRWEWRLFDRPGGRVLAKGSAAGNFEANRALNEARKKSEFGSRRSERGGRNR